ncbi:Concanavalin A-like lectin/glucanases superfamily protein [Candidatus Anstonella stagnisolia]|nr:Concanavalin A-like lectin/glucanases superfamily protein [Candidatus Anstonella stagnisolia]
MKAQGATEYLVILGAILFVALMVSIVLFWPIESAKDAKNQQSDIQFSIALMEYPDLLQGLVAYWKFDENGGTTSIDSKGGANCTFSANATRSPTWTSGKSNYALEYDGADDYVSCGNGLSLPATRTLIAWIKPTDNQRGAVLDKGTQYWMDKSSNVLRYYYYGATNWRTYTSTGLTNGVWQHVAIVEDTSWDMPKFYFNGNEASIAGNSTREADTGSGAATIYIGTYSGSATGDYNFNGTIDEVMIFNRPLSAGEIRLLYENPGYPQ